MKGKPLSVIIAVGMEFCQRAFQPHPLKEMDALWQLFSPKFSHFFENGYFDNDNGQTLFLDDILMNIMVDNGEI